MKEPRKDRQRAILDILNPAHFKGLDPLKELFWSELNYKRVNQPLSRRGWTDMASKALADDPVLFASGGDDGAFHVIYSRLASDRLLLGKERPVISRLLKDHGYALFIFSNDDQSRWHFVNVKYDDQTDKRRLFRRITIGPEERLRTASERLSLLDLEAVSTDLFGLSPLAIQEQHDSAFDVEAVTKQFFAEYNDVFKSLQDDLKRQTKALSWAHDYALQFLNRCMFLYFIQRKGWLGGDTEFLRTFWESYQKASQPANSFAEKWLNVLFFEAFNNKFKGGHRHFPEKIRDALALAPYLNGGLFSENDIDRDHTAVISDKRFGDIFKFLERYNFTIAEDSPLDQEVAVDPEMIGKVYESLVNVSEEADERGDAGIFYTPRTEIDLMCRLALVDNLANHIGVQHKNLLYELVFSLVPDDKESADRAVDEANLWKEIDGRIKDITVLDPACGSGSFLVGMLHILVDLETRANLKLDKHTNPYELKKRIIGQSLYGVDVMDWACHVAELRLWLALIIDADFTREELHIRKEPLLPHFSFKIRSGDSLVQEIGGINFGHKHGFSKISPAMKTRITSLKNEKLMFYNNDPDCKFKSVSQVSGEELRLFRDILSERIHNLKEEIKNLKWKLDGPARQIDFDRKLKGKPHQLTTDSIKLREEMDAKNAEVESIEKSLEALKTAKDMPFVWDIAFVEIFEGEKEGFDIVIGNPPYVRQENIAGPCLQREKVSVENKKEYKAKLARSVYQAFQKYFGYKTATETPAHKLDAKSDLYIYFYFHALSQLNSKGSFCFITSNSWLDVGYGKDLQEFLLKHSQVKMILDNQAKRSFASADVNTIIVLFSAPDDSKEWALNKTARFVMFKVPFEHVIYPVIFQEIEEIIDRKATQEYRVFPVQQNALLNEGWEWPEETTEEEKKKLGKEFKGKYGGNKWGGKYLRAPDIYWTILERGKGKLVRLGDIAEVRRGVTTGVNEFFYLDEERIREWGIEKEFLKPVIISPRECKSIEIVPKELHNRAFVCHKDKTALRGTNALSYIKWGEEQKFNNRPSCSGREHWYEFPEKKWAKVLWPMIHNDRQSVFWNGQNIAVDHNLFEILGYDDDLLWGSLAWSAQILFRELHGRANLGQGALKTEGIDIKTFYVLDVNDEGVVEAIRGARGALSQRDIGTVAEESKKRDRRMLDDIIFDEISLTKGEREGVYEAVINLVEARLKKACSLKPGERRKRKEEEEDD